MVCGWRFFATALTFFIATSIGFADEPAPHPKGGASPAVVPAAPKEAASESPIEDEMPASSGKKKAPSLLARPTYMAIVPEPGGRKTLTLGYRWPLHESASIEVRLVAGPKTEGTAVAPIYFHELLKGKLEEELFKLLDKSDQRGGLTHTFTKEKIVYKMIGQRNSLGHQAVHVQVYTEDARPDSNPAVAFLQLDTWAVNPQVLSLELPRDEFPNAGTLFVWFFRGDKVVWEESIAWPGYGK